MCALRPPPECPFPEPARGDLGALCHPHGNGGVPACEGRLGDLLMAFFEVARQDSVAGATRHLRLSQPTATGRIRQLEGMYGVALFHRHGRRLDLSDLGVSLMPIVERLAQQEGDVDVLLRNAGDLCCIVTATHRYLTEPIAAAFNVPHLLAVEGETVNGQHDGEFTGSPLGTATFGAGKVLRVTQWLAACGQRLADLSRTPWP